MPGAGKRNAVPRKLEIPANAPVSDGMIIHKVTAWEQEDFALKQTTELIKDSGKYWTLSFRKENDAVLVLFTYDALYHGRPERNDNKRPLFKLVSDEWGAFHINGRFASYSGQYYTQHFLNIGNFSEFISDRFVKSAPKALVDEMDHLF
jgi:hypothetical protein